ncbi:MAG: prephenate dehydrogenase/arogenate dehydrogenase family protein, partial [Armatimonadetes bacterium]|nr:prephenate dehydrogenase/arogenate dehydrogenase family protein [Armatimonadota bacterium]
AVIAATVIGASLGMAIRQNQLAREVVGVGRRIASVQLARQLGAIDRFTLDPAEGVREADLVVLATGVATALRLGLEIMPHLTTGCLLTDVSSAKTFLVRGLAPAVRPDVGYLSSHPMAGSEQKGPAAARADLFQNALCILTPTPASRPGDLTRLRALWKAVGCRTTELDDRAHDHFLAWVSHLPHLAATALVEVASPEALPYSAAGFRDATRLASGDPEIWSEICSSNRAEVAAALRRYARELESMASALAAGDDSAVFQKLNAAKRKRDDYYGERPQP